MGKTRVGLLKNLKKNFFLYGKGENWVPLSKKKKKKKKKKGSFTYKNKNISSWERRELG